MLTHTAAGDDDGAVREKHLIVKRTVMSVTDVLGDGTAIPTNIIRLAQQRAERDCNRLTLRV